MKFQRMLAPVAITLVALPLKESWEPSTFGVLNPVAAITLAFAFLKIKSAVVNAGIGIRAAAPPNSEMYFATVQSGRSRPMP